MASLIQFRGDTEARWASTNPILASREMGINTDTLAYKIGNGVSDWLTLPYASVIKDHTLLENIGINSHAQIDSHIADEANPHLTSLDLLIDTALGEPSEGQRLSFNETTGLWEPRNSVSGLGFVVFDYNFDVDITNTPSDGKVQMNNVDPTLATELYFHENDRTGESVDAYWGEIKEGDWFNIYRSNDSSRYYAFDVAGPSVKNGVVWTIPVASYLAEGVALGDGNRVKALWRISQTQVVDNLTSTRVDYSLSANQGRVLDEKKTEWKGPWVNATYELSDMVRDGAYTSICVVPTTTQRPSPQDIGYAGYLFTGTLTPYQQLAKQIIFGTRYVAQTAIKLTGYRVETIAGNEYHLYSIMDPLGTPIVNALHSFVATTTGWVNIAGSETLIGNGLTFDIICELNEPEGTPTVTTLNYNYNKPNNVDITPVAGDINHADKGTDILYINTEDDDGNDNSVFLDTLTAGDIIALDTVRWAIQSISGTGNSRTVGISPAVQSGVNGVQPFNFESVTSTPITVGYELDYNLTYPMSGLYIVDGKYTDIVPDDNQYGLDIEVQEISFSDDWEIVATTTSAGSGGDGGTSIEIVDNLTTQDPYKALSANMGYMLDNDKEDWLDNPGVDGYVLTSTTGGTRSWEVMSAAGGAIDDIFYENAQSVMLDHTIGSTRNAMTAGPVGIDEGIVVTVEANAVWTVV